MRSLHLYSGLIVSPFVLVYAASTIALNHPTWLGGPGEPRTEIGQVRPPVSEDSLTIARDVLGQLGIRGEAMFVRRDVKAGEVEIPVQHAGAKSSVTVDLATGRAVVERHRPSLVDSVIFFHKMPGPHVVAMRGYSTAVALWRWLADASVLAIVFLAASGLYLWTALKAERTVGLVSLGAGAAVFLALVLGMVL
jgi:hypothetical protein